MRKIKEVLRLKYDQGLGDRKIARSVGVSHSTVGEYVRRAEEAGLSWPLPEGMDDGALEARLFPPAPPASVERPLPDWATVRRELSGKGTTLQLLWLEYKAEHPDGYQYSQFCALYRKWEGALDVVLRQPHPAGEKVFVDYTGMTVPVVDGETGEIREAQVFVGTLGASNYTYVEPTWTQSLPDWLGSHVRMLEHFGGVPALIVPDNLRSGVSHASYYEPDINPSYVELAEHYGTAILPARVRRPRDKAKVEAGVQMVERWILAPLRNHTFFSLDELRCAVAPLREALNARPFQKMEGSRRSLFEELDQPAMRPLPATAYEYAEWKKARVNIDCHIQVEKHLYSVPHQLARKQVDVRLTATSLEVLWQGRRVAAHARSFRPGGFTTEPGHLPEAHRRHLEWTPSRLIRWAGTVGPDTAQLATRILEARPHPEQGYRSCLGLMRLAKRYPASRVEAASGRALAIGAKSYRSVKSILENGLDQRDIAPDADEQTTLTLPQAHENVRGGSYYAL